MDFIRNMSTKTNLFCLDSGVHTIFHATGQYMQALATEFLSLSQDRSNKAHSREITVPKAKMPKIIEHILHKDNQKI
jgi:hypothetical protein